jgi:hypothetical protein
MDTMPSAATTAADKPGDPPPPSRPASRAARKSASSAVPRLTISHRKGATPLPASTKGTSIRTGSGFHDGPPSVTRSRWTISRAQISQDQGS